MAVETLLKFSSFVLEEPFIQIWNNMRSANDERIEESLKYNILSVSFKSLKV